jgi:beta-lactam-binding protein with PASTA domain
MWWVLGWLQAIEDFLNSVILGGLYSKRQSESVPIPDVRNMPFNRAWGTLVLAGFDVKVTRLERRPAPVMGIVVGQYPPPGRITRRNARVRITVHHPRDPTGEEAGESPQDGRTRFRFGRRSRVPDVRGLPFSEAWEKLTLADFGVRVDRSRGDPRPVVGAVTAQHPPPGTMAAHRTSVRLTVAPAPATDS